MGILQNIDPLWICLILYLAFTITATASIDSKYKTTTQGFWVSGRSAPTWLVAKWACGCVLVIRITVPGRFCNVWILWEDTVGKISKRIHPELFYTTQIRKQKINYLVSVLTSRGLCICCQQYTNIIWNSCRVYITRFQLQCDCVDSSSHCIGVQCVRRTKSLS